MERVAEVAKYVALGSAALALVATALLGGDRGWWALGMTLIIAGTSLCLVSGIVWLGTRVLERLQVKAASRGAASAHLPTDVVRLPALPGSAKRAEAERLNAQLRAVRKERERLADEVQRLEFRVASVPGEARPAEHVRLGHLRMLDGEYRKEIRRLSAYLRAIEESRPTR
ncbi:MAG: hypothetical protein M3116_06050 [Actinomycetota bacterium]|nr:hypothetical protein [Actinomycetota bacterium]